MKRAALIAVLLLSAAGYVFLQTTTPTLKLAAAMPGGAMLYLEAPDFGALLREWDASKVKAEWLTSANYQVFSRSNLFTKLAEVYGQYGATAGFLPDLKSVIAIAGTDSALALYEIRDVEFLYISRIAESDLMKTQLWAVRDKFEQRRAGGVAFYVRTDPASKRTIAFAFTKGYLLLATRDDLVAQSLELFAGANKPSIASDRWYRDAAASAPNAGELRLVLNLESVVNSVYFRSYWIQRNASAVRRYYAGIADLRRSSGNFVEDRVFLRHPVPAETPAAASDAVSRFAALVPPEASLYQAWRSVEPPEAAALIVRKLIGPPPSAAPDFRYAPRAAMLDSRAGSEGDLETRIDEQPLPPDAGLADSIASVRALVEQSSSGNAAARPLLLVQSSAAAGDFVRTSAVVVLDSAKDWDRNAVQTGLTAAAGKLWTTAGLGAAWTIQTSGRNGFQQLDGLGTLVFANRGRLLFLGNDSRLLTSLLDRVGTSTAPGNLTYAAGFRHSRERSNYERLMTALDFSAVPGNFMNAQPDRPAFFSGNIASLSAVLSDVAEVRLTEEERGNATRQTLLYTVVR